MLLFKGLPFISQKLCQNSCITLEQTIPVNAPAGGYRLIHLHSHRAPTNTARIQGNRQRQLLRPNR